MKRATTLPDLVQTGPLIKPNYGRLKDRMIKLTPASYQCKLFCDGVRCKYCNGTYWPSESQAVTGLYSNWITDDLLAMARPTSSAVENCNIVKQFLKMGIKSIVNLQHIGEHSTCGPPLHSCGFSYNPEEFMRHDIFHYNFGWPDFGVSSLPSMLDMVKVLSFSINQGKTAVHCHAGLGRTGVLICCYLIWAQDIKPAKAIEYVRSKRANSVQNRDQVALIYQFAEFLHPLKSVHRPALDLTSYLNEQQLVLHGVEARILRYIPKIAYVICERMLELAGVHPMGTLDKKLELLAFGDEIFYDQIVARNCQTDSYSTLDRIHRLSDSAGLPALPMRRSSSAIVVPEQSPTTPKTIFPSIIPAEKTASPPISPNLAKWKEDGTWRVVLKQCLMRFIPSHLRENMEQINENLRHSIDGWNLLITEKDPVLLMTILGDWFRKLPYPPVTGSVLLPQNSELQLKINPSQKWTILYLCSVFWQLCGGHEGEKEDTGTLLCDWLTWTREPLIEAYFLSCLNTVSIHDAFV